MTSSLNVANFFEQLTELREPGLSGDYERLLENIQIETNRRRCEVEVWNFHTSPEASASF